MEEVTSLDYRFSGPCGTCDSSLNAKCVKKIKSTRTLKKNESGNWLIIQSTLTAEGKQ